MGVELLGLNRGPATALVCASLPLLTGCGDLHFTNVGNCTQTKVIVRPTHAHAAADLTLSANLVTRKGDRPIVGQKLQFFLKRSLDSAGHLVETVTTGGGGTADVPMAEGYGTDVFLTPAVNAAHVVAVRFQNPDLLTDDKVKKQRYCSSEGHADFSYDGPVKIH